MSHKKTIQAADQPSEERKKAMAATAPNKRTLEPHELVLSPTAQSVVGIHAWSKFVGDVSLADLVGGLRERVEKVHGGDMRSVEAMLYGQAMTLETIFTNLAWRAASQEYMGQFQAYLTLALKAQAQCRATLEALVEIKNPRPVLIARQANVANQQMVNNGAPSSAAPSRAGETATTPNELLEAAHGNGLDSGATGTAGGADPRLEAVGAVNRAANG